MGLTYFKRFRMETELPIRWQIPSLPRGFRFVPWSPALLATHAEAKYQSFRGEIDANVFSCFCEYDGCYRLMNDIIRKDGFLPLATWLIARDVPMDDGSVETVYCGTIQGLRDRTGFGAVQNLGVVPEYRGYGLGSCLLLKALDGFYRSGLDRAFLEVTAQNEGAIRLYRRLGFLKARTVYKAVETPLFAGR